MSDWDSPAWRKIESRLLERRADKLRELQGAALNSSDPSVSGIARQLEEIDVMLQMPDEDKEKDADAD